jgi:DNA-binding MarR family transcriptional regulator
MNATIPHTTRLGATRLPEELLASSTFLLKRLGFTAKERSLQAYEQTGLHPYHHAILIVLDERSHETQGSIADALGYDRGQLVGLLDELEEKGLLQRRRDPNDRRRHLVTLTPEGTKTLRRLRALAREVEDDFLSPLDGEERAALHALLLRLAEKHEPRCAPMLPVAAVPADTVAS